MATTDKKLLNQQQTAAAQPAQTQQAEAAQAQQVQTPAAQTQTQQSAQTQQPVQTQGQTQTQSQQSDIGSLLNMPGVSDTTKQTLGSLVTNGYKPSENVSAAMQELQNIIAQQPAAFQSQHMSELNNIYNQILGRKAFTYDMSNDPFYQNYRQMYINAGKQAMSDTVGQASALTGGYGNSWAATAGQQQYNQYLQQLNDRIPELQQMALDRYNAEGDLLNQQYNLMSDAYNREYSEWQDAYNRWLNERDYAQSNYESERSFDYGQYSDDVNNWYTIAGMEGDQYNADRDYEFQQEQFAYEQEQDAQAQAERDRDYYYDWALTQIENGQMPSAETLLKAGLTEEEVRALLGGGSSGSGSGVSSSGGSGSGNSKGFGYDSETAVRYATVFGGSEKQAKNKGVSSIAETVNKTRNTVRDNGGKDYTSGKKATDQDKTNLQSIFKKLSN